MLPALVVDPIVGSHPQLIKQKGNNMSNPSPIKVFRFGSITASVWKNVNRRGETYYATKFQKSYRDAAGNPAESPVYIGSEALVLSNAAVKVFNFTNECMQRDAAERAEPDMFDDEPAQQSNHSQARRQNTRAPQ